MHQFFWPIVVLIVVLAFANVNPAKGRVPRVKAKALMTSREVSFWRLLCAATEPFHVAPQVAMGALLTTESGLEHARWRTTRNQFDRKIVDFVLLDDGGQVRLIVELDDRTHTLAKDGLRDAMTARAGYQTLRVNGAVARDLHLLRAAVNDALGITMSWSPPAFSPAISPHRVRNTSGRPNTPRA